MFYPLIEEVIPGFLVECPQRLRAEPGVVTHDLAARGI